MDNNLGWTMCPTKDIWWKNLFQLKSTSSPININPFFPPKFLKITGESRHSSLPFEL